MDQSLDQSPKLGEKKPGLCITFDYLHHLPKSCFVSSGTGKSGLALKKISTTGFKTNFETNFETDFKTGFEIGFKTG